jgi:hypothetical protein
MLGQFRRRHTPCREIIGQLCESFVVHRFDGSLLGSPLTAVDSFITTR